MTDAEPARVEEVAQIVREEYQEYRRNLLIQSMLEPRGLDLATYLANQQVLDPTLVREVDHQFAGYNMQLDILIAGHEENECHIHYITHPGIVYCSDAVGFACIGSGSPHATYHLIGEDYRKSLPVERVRELVIEAKRKSEKAPGVGTEPTLCNYQRRLTMRDPLRAEQPSQLPEAHMQAAEPARMRREIDALMSLRAALRLPRLRNQSLRAANCFGVDLRRVGDLERTSADKSARRRSPRNS
jgi:hypothetical protein